MDRLEAFAVAQRGVQVAVGLLRRLREHSKMSEDYGEHYYAMQQEAVEGLFRCAGADAALSLSVSFTKMLASKMRSERLAIKDT